MIKAFAPRDSGGCSWVLLSIVLVGGLPLLAEAQAQQPQAKQEATKKKAEEPAKKAEAEPAQELKEEPVKPAPTSELFVDDRAKKMLDINNYKQLGGAANQAIIREVNAMATGANADRRKIEQFVQNYINDLTNRNYIRAILDPAAAPPGSSAQFAIQKATNDLIDPIMKARQEKNAGFLRTYTQVLLQALPPLLEHHFLVRIEAGIILSQTGSPDAVPLFIKQLENPNQTVWVAMWAARGLTNIQQLSGYNLDPGEATKAAKAVSDFLEREKNLPWPVQCRALEALGSLRQASTIRPANGQPEMAVTATQFLTDPDGRLEVRAQAGWALGMMVVPGAFAQFNYTMIAHSVGDVAATLGERILEAYPQNVTQAEGLSGLLMSQVYQSFGGVTNARESGLLNIPHPSARAAQPFIRKVSDLTKPVTAAALKLVREPSGRSKQNLQDLSSKVTDLKTWLSQNRPPNAWLIPGGDNFPLKGQQVVKAQGERPQ